MCSNIIMFIHITWGFEQKFKHSKSDTYEIGKLRGDWRVQKARQDVSWRFLID